MTFEEYLQERPLQDAARSTMDWSGSLLLRNSESFDAQLLVYHSPGPGIPGIFGRFACSEKDQTILYRNSGATDRPVLDGNMLTVAGGIGQRVRLADEPFGPLEPALVEAFLDAWHRTKILAGLNDSERRAEIVYWLHDHKFPVYRRLTGPEGRTYHKAILPPS